MSERHIKLQDLTRLHRSIRGELDEAYGRVLESSNFILGAEVANFEKAFASYTGAKTCIGTANGTDAIELVLEAMDIGPGKTVALPSMTFAATAEPVARAGAEILFVDVDPATLLMTPATLEAAIKLKKPDAVIIVHLYGQACDMHGFRKLADKYGFKLIEDCAQAHGAKIGGTHVGLFSEAGTFSFFPGKNLGAFGDAGCVITQNDAIAARIKLLRDHGRTGKYDHAIVGRGSRLDALQAAFLSVKLKHLPEWTKSRQRLAGLYQKELSKISDVAMLPIPADISTHTFHQIVVRAKNPSRRAALLENLKSNGIENGIHYPTGVHAQPAFAKLGLKPDLSATNEAAAAIFSLPLDPLMTDDDVRYVCDKVAAFFGGAQ